MIATRFRHLRVPCLLLTVALAAPALGDTNPRQLVELLPPMREHMLANMRDHLLAIETVTRLLAEACYREAADPAEGRLGMSAMQAHGGEHMSPYMPEGMRAAGTARHQTASRFTLAARDAEVGGNLGGLHRPVGCDAAVRAGASTASGSRVSSCGRPWRWPCANSSSP